MHLIGARINIEHCAKQVYIEIKLIENSSLAIH